tara:strand:+ start:138 stop:314 length:177 start_codon:yes stop_codon:yes gene_type:complete
MPGCITSAIGGTTRNWVGLAPEILSDMTGASGTFMNFLILEAWVLPTQKDWDVSEFVA